MGSTHRILFTGGSGTLGYYVHKKIHESNDYRGLSLLRAGSRRWPVSGRMETVTLDLLEKDAVLETIDRFRPDTVIHLAASGMKVSEREKFTEMVRFNVNSTLNLMEGVKTIPGCHFIYLSTGLIYHSSMKACNEEAPIGTSHPYGQAKALVDMLVRMSAAALEIPITIFRPFSFTGVGDHSERLFPGVLEALSKERPIQLQNPHHVRDYLAAEDVVRAIFLAISRREDPSKQGLEIYNLGSGSNLSVLEMIQKVMSDLGLKGEVSYSEISPNPHSLYSDSSRAERELGWKPEIPLSTAVLELARTIEDTFGDI